MGIYAEYLDAKLDIAALNTERKMQLSRIAHLRGNRAILTFASALSKTGQPIGIDFDDRACFFDQLGNLEGDKIDVILETPGGLAEVVEEFVEELHRRFIEVAMIIPGWAKSAGTLMAFAGDEILMEPTSALGPIDAQISQGEKRFSAHAFLEGLKKICDVVHETGQLNRAYIPILQNISPGEIQSCENALEFSKTLITRWLLKYKFRPWLNHSSTGAPVIESEKEVRAKQIAEKLCDHGYWKTHGRSILIRDLQQMGVKITDYSATPELSESIRRYHTLLKITFDVTNIYKLYETPISQIYRHSAPMPQNVPPSAEKAIIDFVCSKCKTLTKIQANLKKGIPLEAGTVPFPNDNVLICGGCDTRHDISGIRGQIEAQSKRAIISEVP